MERMDTDIVFTGLGTFRIPILVKDVTSDLTTFHSRLSLRNNPTQYAYPQNPAPKSRLTAGFLSKVSQNSTLPKSMVELVSGDTILDRYVMAE